MRTLIKMPQTPYACRRNGQALSQRHSLAQCVPLATTTKSSRSSRCRLLCSTTADGLYIAQCYISNKIEAEEASTVEARTHSSLSPSLHVLLSLLSPPAASEYGHPYHPRRNPKEGRRRRIAWPLRSEARSPSALSNQSMWRAHLCTHPSRRT